MQVYNGDEVLMRDGRTVMVTDAADADPDMYRWYGIETYIEDGKIVEREVINDEMPPETIFVGYDTKTNATVASDMSEVSSRLNW